MRRTLSSSSSSSGNSTSSSSRLDDDEDSSVGVRLPGEDHGEEDDGELPPLPEPPCYTSVLLEDHLAKSKKHTNLFPDELLRDINCLLFSSGRPTLHPYRTYHTLPARSFPEGRGTYKGELDHKSRREGYGHMIYSTGDCYQGWWKKGLREGQGCYFWAETGSVYSGTWKAGERNGVGHFVFGTRRESMVEGVIFSGVWVQGKIKGGEKGLVSFVNQDTGRVERLEDVLWCKEHPQHCQQQQKTLPDQFRGFIKLLAARF